MVTKEEREVGIDTYTLLYIKEIINKDLLYSTRNSTQYSLMTYMRIEPKNEWREREIYIYIYLTI